MSLDAMIRDVREHRNIPCHSPEALELLDILEAHLAEERATHAILAADLDAVMTALEHSGDVRTMVSTLILSLKRALDVPPNPLPPGEGSCRHCGRPRDAHYYGHHGTRPCVVDPDSTTYAPRDQSAALEALEEVYAKPAPALAEAPSAVLQAPLAVLRCHICQQPAVLSGMCLMCNRLTCPAHIACEDAATGVFTCAQCPPIQFPPPPVQEAPSPPVPDLPPFDLRAACAAQGYEANPSRPCSATPSFAPVLDALVALQAQLARREAVLARVVAAVRDVAAYEWEAVASLPVDLGDRLDTLGRALAAWDALRDAQGGEE